MYILTALTPVEEVGTMLFGRGYFPLQPTQNPYGELSTLVWHLVPEKSIDAARTAGTGVKVKPR